MYSRPPLSLLYTRDGSLHQRRRTLVLDGNTVPTQPFCQRLPGEKAVLAKPVASGQGKLQPAVPGMGAAKLKSAPGFKGVVCCSSEESKPSRTQHSMNEISLLYFFLPFALFTLYHPYSRLPPYPYLFFPVFFIWSNGVFSFRTSTRSGYVHPTNSVAPPPHSPVHPSPPIREN